MAMGVVTSKQRSVDASRFAMVPRNDVPRSAFDTSHTHKTTFNAGTLVPVYIDEILPGDSVRLSMTAFCRLATPLVPIMDNLILESFFFYVPNRLVWDNWARFMGEQLSPTDSTTFLMPYITVQGNEVQSPSSPHSLPDWFGITLNGSQIQDLNVNALPFRAYVLIWNEWFRDQDLQDPLLVPKGDGPDTFNSYGGVPLGQAVFGLVRGKRHDYFTSARPWPQKPMNVDIFSAMGSSTGFNNMQMEQLGSLTQPWGAGAPVTGLGVMASSGTVANAQELKWSGGRRETPAEVHDSSAATFYMDVASNVGDYPNVRVLVNDIRMSVMIQGMLERNARGGTRYTELVRTHFGVTSPDARLQRPEFLGGGRMHIAVNPVAQTSATGVAGTTTVLGELAGVGTGVATGHGFSQSFTEHGYVIGLVSVRADLTYQNGVNRMWFRRTQFDFYWPALAHLGEQAIYSREIFCNGTGDPGTGLDDDSVFGYQERWSEYKYKPNRVSGLFRSTNPGGAIDVWHLAENFGSRPALNDLFIRVSPTPVDRVLQTDTTSTAQFLFDSVFNVRMVRAMPMFSLPGLGPRL